MTVQTKLLDLLTRAEFALHDAAKAAREAENEELAEELQRMTDAVSDRAWGVKQEIVEKRLEVAR